MAEQRYKVIPGSQSAHCCFEATVVDTQTPHTVYRGYFDSVCECFDMADAEKVCNALNIEHNRNAELQRGN